MRGFVVRSVLVVEMNCKKQRSTKDDGDGGSAESIERVGDDIIQYSILSRVDSGSLARCRAVSKPWKSMASSDLLWLPLCCNLLASRAQLPLKLVPEPQLHDSLSPRVLFGLIMEDACKTKLFPNDICGRTWELCIKPSCRPYWYYLDPTSRGEPALVRFFHCDGSVTAEPADPIWGGQESYWRFVFEEEGSGLQYVKVNYWPLLTVLRLNDGRWRLENKWATYTTQADLCQGTGNAVCKEAAPICSGCSFPRLRNARFAQHRKNA